MGDLSEHFSRWEFACRCGCGFNTVDAQLLQVLQALRTAMGKPVSVHSGARCARHNAELDPPGAPNSYHLCGQAADIEVDAKTNEEVGAWLRAFDIPLGVGIYKTHVHVDVRGRKAEWSR